MSRLLMFLFGSPRIQRDGLSLQIRRRRAVALLAYLAVTGRGHGRDVLSTLFYPEHDQSQARAGLRRTLSALRRAIGEGGLDIELDTVALSGGAGLRSQSDPDDAFWLDVAVFQDLLARCRSHGHPRGEVCPVCLPPLGGGGSTLWRRFYGRFHPPRQPRL